MRSLVYLKDEQQLLVAKKKLRNEILQERRSLDRNYRDVATKAITETILAMAEFTSCQCLFTYIGVGDEFDTRELINRSVSEQKRVGVPRVSGKHQLVIHQFQNYDALTKSSFGLLEPQRESPIIEPAQLDLIIVPCVTSNLKGERLGYGGGFYDHFLRSNQVKAVTVLPIFSPLLREDIPLGEYDQAVDIVVTESGIVYNRTNL